VPGPACYGHGGTEPTITDCNLVLGYLGVNNKLAGRMTLDADAAHRAVERVAQKLGMSAADAAEGIVRIIDVKMQEAIKAISTMRGHDLSDFHLLAFGGAGPLHAARIAAELGMAGVVVPLYPGVYSAMGLLMSDVKHDYIRSKIGGLAKTNVADVGKVFDELEAHALKDLHEEGFAKDRIAIERSLDLRYAGQGYEITVAVDYPLNADSLKTLRTRFDDTHKQMFGHTAPDEPVEIVSYRLRGVGRVPEVTLPKFRAEGRALKDALRETRRARFGGKTYDCPIYLRDRLDVGISFEGPAIVDQLDATTVVPVGHTARVDEFKNLLITARAS
jgi:N-methylhydantoinase A